MNNVFNLTDIYGKNDHLPNPKLCYIYRCLLEKIIYTLFVVGNFIAHAAEVVAQYALQLLSTSVSAVQNAVEVVEKAVDAVVEWIKEQVINGINALMESLRNLDNNISDIIKIFALDMANGRDVNADLSNLINDVARITGIVATAFLAFAAIEIMIDASTGGIIAVISDLVMGLLKAEVVSAIISLFLIADATVQSLDTVGKKVGYNITEGTMKNLFKAFDIAVSLAGETWSIYQAIKERTSGKWLFYFGLALTILSAIASIDDADTLGLHGVGLKYYRFTVVGIGVLGLGIMYRKAKDAPEQLVSSWTGLLEWIVGWAGLMSALVKLSADAAAGWR